MTNYIIIYFLSINIILFILTYIDKQKAIHHKWRIRESTLIGLAFLGGSIGLLLGMYTFRHKTKHPLFFIGGPLILIFQLYVLLFIFFS